MLDNKSIFTFRYDVWPVGHAPMNYARWRVAQVPYKVDMSNVFFSMLIYFIIQIVNYKNTII